MRFFVKKWVVGITSLSYCSLAWSAPESLTWQKSVEETARSNAELRAARDSVEAAEHSIGTSRSALYPQVSTSVGYGYGATEPPGQSVLEGDSSDPRSSYSASLSIQQSLFSGWADRARIDQAKSAAVLAAAQAAAIRARISRELKSAYAGLIFAQRSVTMQEDILRRRQENLRLVELRYDSGRENKGSVMLSRAYLEQARFEVLQARNSILLAQSQLMRILGRDVQLGDSLRVVDEVPASKPPAVAPDFNALAKTTPTHQQSLAQESSAGSAVTVARAGYFPTLALGANLGRQGTEWFPNNENWTLGLTLSYPLFSGGRDRSASAAANANLRVAQDTRLNVDRSLATQLQQAFNGWVEGVEGLKVESSFLEAATLRAEIARNRYNNGLLSFEDWDLIESELISRQRSVLRVQRDRVVAEANWEEVQGKGVMR